MASISSTGIGSGLDVTSIITQLVALEKQPLKVLEAKATNVKTQVSTLGDIQSQFATLSDTATRLSSSSAWSARTTTSSNTSAATITSTDTADATTFTLDVDALATSQSVTSPGITSNGSVGEGTMTFRAGAWTGGGSTPGVTLATAQAALTTAQDDLVPLQDALTLAQADLDAANLDLAAKNLTLSGANTDLAPYQTALTTKTATLNLAQSALTAGTTLRDSLNDQLTLANTALTAAQSTLTTSTDARNAAVTASNEAQDALSARQATLTLADTAVSTAETALVGTAFGSIAGDLATARFDLRAFQATLNTAADTLNAANAAKATVDEDYNQKLSLSNAAAARVTSAQSLSAERLALNTAADTQLSDSTALLGTKTLARDAAQAALDPLEASLATTLVALNAANTTKTTLQAALQQRQIELAAAQDPTAAQAAYDTADAAYSAASSAATAALTAYQGSLTSIEPLRSAQLKTQSDYAAALGTKLSQEQLREAATEQLAGLTSALSTQSTALDTANSTLSPLEATVATKLTALNAANATKESLRTAIDAWDVLVAQSLPDITTADAQATASTNYDAANNAQTAAQAAYDALVTPAAQDALQAARTEQQKAQSAYSEALGTKLAQEQFLGAASDQLLGLSTALGTPAVAGSPGTPATGMHLALDTAVATLTAAQAAYDAGVTPTTTADLNAARSEHEKTLGSFNSALAAKNNQDLVIATATAQLALAKATLEPKVVPDGTSATEKLAAANAALADLEDPIAAAQAALAKANDNKASLLGVLNIWDVAVAQNLSNATTTAASRAAAQTAYDDHVVGALATATTDYSVALADPALLNARTEQQKAQGAYNYALAAKNNQDLVIATATAQLALAETVLTTNTTALTAANGALVTPEKDLVEQLVALNAANAAKTTFEAVRQEKQIALTAANTTDLTKAQSAVATAQDAYDTANTAQGTAQSAYTTALSDPALLTARTALTSAQAEYEVALADNTSDAGAKAVAQAAYEAAVNDESTQTTAAATALAAIPDRTLATNAVADARTVYDARLADVRTKQDAVGAAQDAYDTAAAKSTDLTLARQAQVAAKIDVASALSDANTKAQTVATTQAAYTAAVADEAAKALTQATKQTAFDTSVTDLATLQGTKDAAQADLDALTSGPMAGLLTAQGLAQTDVTDAQAVQLAKAALRQTALTARDAGQLAVDSATAAVNNRPSFVAAAGSTDISVAVTALDTVATLAAKINGANVGVTAVVFKDGVNDRLQLTSKATGVDAGFRVLVTDTGDSNDTDSAGLSRFGFDPQTLTYGMAAPGASPKFAQDARARINGVAVASSTNTLTDNLPGVTVNLLGTTTTSVNMAVKEDVTVAVKNVNDFVTAYNALNKTLADATKYDPGTKVASIFQADSTILGMQSMLRGMFSSTSSGSVYSRLNDVGLARKLDGSISLDTKKVSIAANNGTELSKLFTTNNSNAQTNGFALKFATMAQGLLGSTGAVTNKSKALADALARNAKDQTKVNDRAAATEARLRKTYSALDTKMASLTALNSYVAQQVTAWNKSTN